MHTIEREHPDYTARQAMWRRHRLLYAGGEDLKANASELLRMRHKEPSGVYAERLDHCFYENYIGSIIDWYGSTLFRREPLLQMEGRSASGRDFFSALAEDCDLRGSSLSDFFRRQLVETLVNGVSYTVVDFPRTPAGFTTRAEEDRNGASRAFLVNYRAEDLINWSTDEAGRYEWVVLRTERQRPGTTEDDEPSTERRWIRYDREEYRIYRGTGEEGKEVIELVDEGRHGLAKLGMVPVFELKVSEGLWLMNKASLLQVEHFNKSNALSWALTMGLFAMPVIYSERTFNQTLGESYFLQLDPNDKFGWTEPEGRVYQIAAENLSRLKDEIYRVCYLMTQAGGPLSGNPASGLSKQRDFAITQEVLRAYGDAVKDVLKRVLRAVEAAREDGLAIDVSGLDDFDIGDFSSELADAERLLNLGVESRTLRTQVLKKLVFKYLCDVRQDVKDRIGREIEESGA